MTHAGDAALHRDRRPTLRDIARRVGVTATTVSRALHNNSKISAQMRARVQQVARELGYRPDPEMAKLMHHLRQRRKPRFHGIIAAITTRPPGRLDGYLQAIASGARRAADELGYTFELFHVGEGRSAQRSLQRVLVSRGVEGVVLLPMAQPLDLSGLLDWSQFSAVAATGSVLSPHLHRITPDHFANTKLLCARLAARGCRRIGLVVRAHQDVRVDHAFTAAVTWHNTFRAHAAPQPLFFDDPGELQPAPLAAWIREARPDAIITTDEEKCEILSRALDPKAQRGITLASTNTTTASPWPGIDEQPAEVGSTAIYILAGMIQRGSRDVPDRPTATIIEGAWCEGRARPSRS